MKTTQLLLTNQRGRSNDNENENNHGNHKNKKLNSRNSSQQIVNKNSKYYTENSVTEVKALIIDPLQKTQV